MKAAVAPPEPLLEPPVHRSRSQGLRAVSNAWDKLVVPNSVILSLPRRMGTGSVSCHSVFVLHLCHFLNQEDLMEREAMVQNS